MSKKKPATKVKATGGSEHAEEELARVRRIAAGIVRSFQGTDVTVGEVFTALACATLMLSESVGDSMDRCLKAQAAATGHKLLINCGADSESSIN